jgi:hypothetical protein
MKEALTYTAPQRHFLTIATYHVVFMMDVLGLNPSKKKQRKTTNPSVVPRNAPLPLANRLETRQKKKNSQC